MAVARVYSQGRRASLAYACLSFVLGCACMMALGAGGVAAEDRSSAERDAVVATVDGEPVYRSEVDRLRAEIGRRLQVDPAALPMLQARALAEIVDRRLVLAYAKRTKSGATPAEIDAALAEFVSKLKGQGSSIERFLKERSIGTADLRRQIAWKLTWEKYLARYVSDARLQQHFEKHRRHFDGSRVSVSHILLRPKGDDRAEELADLVRRARTLREQFVAGKVSFAEAARKHSAGPSGKQGGRLGPIARHGAMVEAFSKAAFALQVGQVSQPVTTRFGVHLIRCDAVQPGSKKWTDVREELLKSLERELLDRLARHQQRYSSVEFTGKAPYLKPGTRELVLP